MGWRGMGMGGRGGKRPGRFEWWVWVCGCVGCCFACRGFGEDGEDLRRVWRRRQREKGREIAGRISLLLSSTWVNFIDREGTCLHQRASEMQRRRERKELESGCNFSMLHTTHFRTTLSCGNRLPIYFTSQMKRRGHMIQKRYS